MVGLLALPSLATAEVTPQTDTLRVVGDLDGAPRPTATIQRSPGPIQVDGRLDEPAWAAAEVISDFVQQRPDDGRPATERTEVRLLYDDEFLYVGAELYDSDPSGIITPTLERDPNTRDGDAFGIILDTFLDRSSAFAFYINPGGAVRDGQAADDGRNTNFAWDGAFDLETRVHDRGWTVEMAIPWSTLRFDPGRINQEWGLNLLRRIRRKNEDSVWAPMDRQRPLHTPSLAGTLVGLEGIQPGRNLSLKPFALSSRPTGELVDPQEESTDFDAGLDLKYGLTPGLTLDLTYNTDFSQVEVDQQQVNLTRFSLFFPERRDFFLENQGIFTFGDRGSMGQRTGAREQDFTLFHSRRIGLTPTGDPIGILGGGRVSGTIGSTDLGVINMQTRREGDLQPENFSVARIRFRPASGLDVGGIAIQRRTTSGDVRMNRSYGVDANYQLGNYLLFESYLAGTQGTELDRDLAGRFSVRWRNPFWEAMALYRRIGDDFEPGVGFVQRNGIHHRYGTLGITPRVSWPLVQELNPYMEVDHFSNLEGVRETRTLTGGLDVDFRDGSDASILIREQFEWIQFPFTLRGVTIDPGRYTFREAELDFSSSRARSFSASAGVTGGEFYGGDRFSLGGSVLWRPSQHFLLDLEADHNRIDLPGADSFTADVYGARFRYLHSTRFLTSTFIQYNEATDELITNIRLNWIHAPLSDFFLVLTERREMGSNQVMERVVSAKLTRLFSF